LVCFLTSIEQTRDSNATTRVLNLTLSSIQYFDVTYSGSVDVYQNAKLVPEYRIADFQLHMILAQALPVPEREQRGNWEEKWTIKAVIGHL
jgi:hypothetical protein